MTAPAASSPAARRERGQSSPTRRDAGIDRRRPIAIVALAGVWAALVLAGVLAGSSVEASSHAVDLGTAGTYSVLGGQTVTNTGLSVLSGDLGVSPGTAITGFPPGIVLGTVHAHSSNPATLLFPDVERLSYDFEEEQAR